MATKYLFLSAGSGITPLMSMTRTLYDLGSDADVLFIHNARTPADIIFRRELDAIASMTPNIRVVHICEGDCLSEPWGGLRGRLSTAALEAIAPDLMDRVTFTCGPSAYMESVRKILTETGYDMRNYHEESFTFESLPRPTRSAVDADRELPTYGSPLADETPALFVGGSQETAVYSFEAASLSTAVPRECVGRCVDGWPHAVLLLQSGHVWNMQDHADVRRRRHATQRRNPPQRIAQNKILICCPNHAATSGLTVESGIVCTAATFRVTSR